MGNGDNCIELQLRVKAIEEWKESHMETSHIQYTELQEQLQKVLVCIHDNTTTIASIHKETQGISQLYRDAQGVFRLGKFIQDALVMITKFGALGALILVVVKYIKVHFPQLF